MMQSQREQSPAVRAQAPALPVKLFEIVTITFAAFGERIDHVSTRLIVDGIAVVALAGVE